MASILSKAVTYILDGLSGRQPDKYPGQDGKRGRNRGGKTPAPAGAPLQKGERRRGRAGGPRQLFLTFASVTVTVWLAVTYCP